MGWNGKMEENFENSCHDKPKSVSVAILLIFVCFKLVKSFFLL